MGSTSSRSSVAFDLDDDGDLDIVTNEWNDHPQVLISNLSGHKQIHYLKIRLIGTVSNRDGLGATAKVRSGAKTYTRYHDGKSGYLSQSSMPATSDWTTLPKSTGLRCSGRRGNGKY